MSIFWLTQRDIRHFYAELLSEHGGLAGAPSEGALDSTLARSHNLLAYEPESPLARLAASYAFDFARNHCFPDGDKRIALTAIGVFLYVNGKELIASEPDAALTIESVAGGEMSEEELAAWIEGNSRLLDDAGQVP